MKKCVACQRKSNLYDRAALFCYGDEENARTCASAFGDR